MDCQKVRNLAGVPVIISRGTPYEIGYSHGKSMAESVHRSYEYNMKACMDDGQLSCQEVYRIAEGFLRPIEQYNRDYIEELQGIADGCGMKLIDLIVLNSRTELKRMTANKVDQKGRPLHIVEEGCTSIAVTGERTVDGATYIGQNWDFSIFAHETLFYHVIEQKNGRPSIACCGEAGIITRGGINSCGLGVGVNALFSDAPINLDGVPLQFLIRGVLDSRNMEEAIDALVGGHNAVVHNLTIAYRGNEVVSVEMDSECCDVIPPENGIAIHTNHYLSPRLPRYPHVERAGGSSYQRYNRGCQLLRQFEKLAMKDVETVFCDHGPTPESRSICVHRKEFLPKEKQSESIYSYLANLDTLEVHLAPNGPCRGYLSLKPFDWLE